MKLEVRDLITGFCNLVENQFGDKVKCIRFDNGLEFKLVDFFRQKGIVHQTSCTYTPQQNSSVERKHGHLLSTAKSLRFQARLLECFQGECVLHATYIINRLPSAAINNQIPYQVLMQKFPHYKHLKVYGCLAYATTMGPRSKLDVRARKCTFLGYANGTKGYKVYDLVSKELFISRDVVFYEHIFPFQQVSNLTKKPSQIILPTVSTGPIENSKISQTQNQACLDETSSQPTDEMHN